MSWKAVTIQLVTILVLLAPVVAQAAPTKEQLAQRDRAARLYVKKDFRAARSVLQGYLKKQPKDAQAHYLLGMVEMELQNFKSAAYELEKSIRLSPKLQQAKDLYPIAVEGHAIGLVSEGRFEAALAEVEKASRFQPGDWNLHFCQGAVLFERWRQLNRPEDHTLALEAWKQAQKLKPLSATGYLVNGISAYEGLDYSRALAEFNTARQLNPNNRYVSMWTGIAHAALKEYDEAEQEFRQALVMLGDNPSLYRYLGDVHAFRGRYDEALEAYRKSLELKPGDPKLHVSLARVYEATDQFEEAIEQYRYALDLDQKDFESRFQLAVLFRKNGQPDHALDSIKTAETLVPQLTTNPRQVEVRQARVGLEKALTYLARGERSQAGQAFTNWHERIFTTYPKDIPPMEVGKMLLYRGQIGNPEKRPEYLEKALKWSGPGAAQVHVDAYVAYGDYILDSGMPRGKSSQRLGSKDRLVNAMYLYEQAWQRVPEGSPKLRLIRERFQKALDRKIAALESEKVMAALFLKGQDLREYQATQDVKIRTLRGVRLGTPGLKAVASDPSVQAQILGQSVIPDDFRPELTMKIEAPSSAAAAVDISPGWEFGPTAAGDPPAEAPQVQP